MENTQEKPFKTTSENVSGVLVELQFISKQLDELKETVNNFRDELKQDLRDVRNEYLTKVEFYAKYEPIQRVVYGLVGMILLGVLAGVLALVILKH